jgi:two-component sensor histidine kinase
VKAAGSRERLIDVSALSDLLHSRTTLSEPQIAHLQRLVGDWQLLSDLSFADLLLWVPVSLAGGEADEVEAFLCAAQCRPTTGPTAYQSDHVGVVSHGERALPLLIARSERRIYRAVEPDWDSDLPIRREAIPVRLPRSDGVGDGDQDGADEVFAVVGKDANLVSSRTPSQLELVYLQSAADLSAMVAEGSFPNPAAELEPGAGPRVGDGLLRVQADRTIIYASPNAVSAFSRLGVTGPVVGETIDDLGSQVADDPFDARDLGDAVRAAIDEARPAGCELDGGGTTVQFRALPLVPRGERLGALVLLQDVTELRRRDRQIMSKDATIREIHHRVKNNLQTVAALLRLQARRVSVPEARVALEESMRRVSSIALVHETLSVSVDEHVAFGEIVDRLLRMLGDVMGSAGRVSLERECEEGDPADVPAEVATGLVLVLTELVQNALEHAFPDGRQGTVRVRVRTGGGALRLTVEDDGAGLPADFDPQTSPALGLQIVRTLVSAELAGSVSYEPRAGGGTCAVVTVPLTSAARRGR